MTLAILVYMAFVIFVDAGILSVAAHMVSRAERKPTPAENARRYTDEGGTW